MSDTTDDGFGQVDFSRGIQEDDRAMLLDVVTNGMPGLLITAGLHSNGKDLRFELEPIGGQFDDDLIESILEKTLDAFRKGRAQSA